MEITPTTSLPIGVILTIKQNEVYALPTEAVWLTSSEILEFSLDEIEWVVSSSDILIGAAIGFKFVKCTTSDAVVVCKEANDLVEGTGTPIPGPPGPQGVQGPKGETGDVGPQGEIGDVGPKGDKGDKGDIGLTGLTGPEGPQGIQGIQGIPGPTGPKGDQGPQGQQGLTGPQGFQGEVGPAGPQGPIGPTGAQGAQGPAGAGTPAGLDKEIQFNFNGIFGASPDFTYDNAKKQINLGGQGVNSWREGIISFDSYGYVQMNNPDGYLALCGGVGEDPSSGALLYLAGSGDGTHLSYGGILAWLGTPVNSSFSVYASDGLVEAFNVNQRGEAVIYNSLAIGTDPAQSGAIRLPLNGAINWRATGYDAGIWMDVAPSLRTPSIFPQGDNVYALGYPTVRWIYGCFGDNIQIGTNPAQSGSLRVAAGFELKGRDGNNTFDSSIINHNGWGSIALGDSTLGFYYFGNKNLFSAPIELGYSAAKDGVLRLRNNEYIKQRNKEDTIDVNLIGINQLNNLLIGSGSNGAYIDSDADVALRAHGGTSLLYIGGAGYHPGVDAVTNIGFSNVRYKDGWFSGTVNAEGGLGSTPLPANVALTDKSNAFTKTQDILLPANSPSGSALRVFSNNQEGALLELKDLTTLADRQSGYLRVRGGGLEFLIVNEVGAARTGWTFGDGRLVLRIQLGNYPVSMVFADTSSEVKSPTLISFPGENTLELCEFYNRANRVNFSCGILNATGLGTTPLNAAYLTGSIPDASLSANVLKYTGGYPGGTANFLRADGTFVTPPANTGPQGPQGIPGADGITGMPCYSGLWQSLYPYAALGTQACAANHSRLTRTTLLFAVQAAQIENSAAASGGKVRVVVYADTATGPGALVTQSADVACDAASAKTTAISFAAGTYWIGIQNVGSVAVTMRAILAMNPFLPGVDAPGNNNTPSCWYANPGASAPNPWPTTGITKNGAAYAVYVQRA